MTSSRSHRTEHPEEDGVAEAAAAETGAETVPGAADERYLRLAADFENFKRRKAQELEDRARYASEDAARAFLPVLDNLRRAVDHMPAESVDAGIVGGLQMVVQQFEVALADLGVTRVEGVGSRFDPAVHEAIGGEESEEVGEDTVIAELQPGYRLHDRLIRPALVRVAHPASGGSGAPA